MHERRYVRYHLHRCLQLTLSWQPPNYLATLQLQRWRATTDPAVSRIIDRAEPITIDVRPATKFSKIAFALFAARHLRSFANGEHDHHAEEEES